MEVNNNTVIVMLIMAIIISLGGTVTVLTKLSGAGAHSITGMAINGSGTARINISSNLAIVIDPSYNDIDFGTCTVPPAGSVQISSNMTEAQINLTSINCSTITPFPAFIRINNTGNVIADIDAQAMTNANTLFSTTGAAIGARGYTGAVNGGCTTPSSWVTIDGGATQVCGALTTGMSTTDVYINFTIPYSARTSGPAQTIIRFTASAT